MSHSGSVLRAVHEHPLTGSSRRVKRAASVSAAAAPSQLLAAGDLLPATAENYSRWTVCLGMMDDTCTRCAIAPWRTLLFFFLTFFFFFCVGAEACAFWPLPLRLKTTQIIICVMYSDV